MSTLQKQVASPLSGALRKSPADFVTALFTSHSHHVFRWALRLLGNVADAEEATQDVFIRVLRGTQSFEGRSAPTTWLYQITKNLCLNVLRMRRTRAELADLTVMPVGGSALCPEHHACLRQILSSADDRQTLAGIYVHSQGHSQQEAAKLLGVSRRTVGYLLDRLVAHAAGIDSLAGKSRLVSARYVPSARLTACSKRERGIHSGRRSSAAPEQP